jgi:hypothetical protein
MRKKTHKHKHTPRYTQTFPPFSLDNEKPLQPHSSDDNGKLYISGVPVKSSTGCSPALAVSLDQLIEQNQLLPRP